VTVGLIQMKIAEAQVDNLAKTIDAVRALAKKGAQIISTSELFLSRYFCQKKDDRFFSLAEAIPGPTTNAFSLVAREMGVVIVVSVFEKAGTKYFNTAAVIDADGTLLGTYRKMHIPDDPEHGYGEATYFSSGDLGVRVFETKYARIAPMICWDQWFPEGARIAASEGAQILFYPTAIGWHKNDSKPIRAAEHDAWQTVQRSHSIANNIFTVAVNRVGVEDDLRFWGTSFVSDPYGRVIAKGSTKGEKNIIVKCDLGLIEAMRKDWPFLDSRKIGHG